MAKSKSGGLEARLEALAAIRETPHGPEAKQRLERALNSKTGLVAATAAEIVRDHELADYAPLLQKAFFRFLENPVKTDAQCRAKLALVQTLDRLEVDAEDVFRAGLRHVQYEPVWGGKEDTAADLRAVSAWALTRFRPHDLIYRLVDLLADPERGARIGAIRALDRTGRSEAEAVLRLKARLGDDDIEVVGACFEALLAFEAEDNRVLVASYLSNSEDALQETAALSLGQSRRSDALAPLIDWVRRTPFLAQKEVGFIAVAGHRSAQAVDFLMERSARADLAEAKKAIEALAILKHDPEVKRGLKSAVQRRGDDSLMKTVEALFS